MAGLLDAQGVITTVAGTDWIFPRSTMPAIDAPLGLPTGLAIDPDGSLLVLDSFNQMVLRITRDGVATVIAGNGLGGYSGDLGPATRASMLYPNAFAVDAAGNLYVADTEGRSIRAVTREGIIGLISGGGDAVPADGVRAADAQFLNITSLAILPNGDLAVADDRLNRIFRIGGDGILRLVAGTGRCESAGDGGPGRGASVCEPDDLAADAQGNLYFIDVVARFEGIRRVRRIAPDGTIAAYAGNGTSGRVLGGRPATDTPLQPTTVAVHPKGGIVIASAVITAETNRATTDLARVDADGRIELFPSADLADILLTKLAVDGEGFVYAATALPTRLFRVSPDGSVEHIAGNERFRFGGDGGPAALALINAPMGLSRDRDGNLFIAEAGDGRIRKITPDGIITTVAGSGRLQVEAPKPGTKATENPLLQPFLSTVGPDGRYYFTTSFGIHRLNDDGSQTAEPYPAPGPGGIAFDASGNLLYADRGRNFMFRARNGAPNSLFAFDALVAGVGRASSNGDGGPATAAGLNAPADIAIDPAGNIYVSESAGHRVRRIDPAGVITTFAGNGEASDQPIPSGPRPATSISLTQPTGLAFDNNGDLLVRSVGHMSRVTRSGQLEVIAGVGPSAVGSVIFGDGGLATEAALGPYGDIATDELGNIYLTEVENHRVRKILSEAPAFRVSTDSLTFAGASAGAPSPAQTLVATGDIPGLGFAIAARTADGVEWLRVNASAGATPLLVQVTADPAKLAPGVYTGTIEFTVPLGRPKVFPVAVRFEVGAALEPNLQVDKRSVTFTYPKTAATRSQNLLLTNAGSGEIAVEVATPEGAFLRVSPPVGTVTPGQPLQLTVSADPAGRRPGLYESVVTIHGAGATRQVPVTMTIGDREHAIQLSQSGLSFQAVAGGGAVPTQAFGILNAGNGAMPWRISTSTLAGGAEWLAVSRQNGATEAAAGSVPTVDVRIDQAGLAPGVYHGLVQVESDDAANSPQVLPVFLEVLPADARPASIVQPGELTFTGEAGEAIGSQELTVFNLTRDAVAFGSSASLFAPNQPLQYAPIDSNVAPSEPQRVVLQPQAHQLPPGAYRSDLSFQFADGVVRRVAVNVVIRPPSSAASKDGARAADGCSAKRLIPSLRSLGQASSVPAGWPAGVVVDVTDDCGTPMLEGTVTLALSNGDPPVALESLRDGRWHGTWTTRSGRPGPVTVRVVAENNASQLRGEQESAADLRAAEQSPSLVEEGIVNAPLAPGGLLTLSGAGFTVNQSLTAAPGEGLPDRLGETEVIITGRRAPLFSAGEDRIQAIVPLTVNPNTRHQVLVRRGATYSRAVQVNVAAARPAIVLNPDGGPNRALARIVREGSEPFFNTAAAPARAGDRVMLVCTGLGAVDDPGFAAGRPAGAEPSKVVSPVAVRVGGATAEVAAATLDPGEIGRYLVTFIVPNDVAVADDVELVVEAEGQTSAAAALAVR
ncbi:MAG: hypothetical protein R2729_31350 [Bryobacteraceae bacterium]